mmetsp:Transcript_2906/g.11567  ORF Transcript_2906/g.11567 Transcript_2906/m.11567 type:complete len:306 (+) Transcript_2906:606-1523(+)
MSMPACANTVSPTCSTVGFLAIFKAISPPGRNKSRRANTPRYVSGLTSFGTSGSGGTFSSPSFSICLFRLASAYRAHSAYAPFVAYRKSPRTFMISWFPWTTSTSPPALRACFARDANLRMMASSLSPRSSMSPTCTKMVSPPIHCPSGPITLPSSSARMVCLKSPCTSPMATRRRPARSTLVTGVGTAALEEVGSAPLPLLPPFALANAAPTSNSAGIATAALARSARRATVSRERATAEAPEAPPAAASATMERAFPPTRRAGLVADEPRSPRRSRREDALSPNRGPIAPPRGRENGIVEPAV